MCWSQQARQFSYSRAKRSRQHRRLPGKDSSQNKLWLQLVGSSQNSLFSGKLTVKIKMLTTWRVGVKVKVIKLSQNWRKITCFARISSISLNLRSLSAWDHFRQFNFSGWISFDLFSRLPQSCLFKGLRARLGSIILIWSHHDSQKTPIIKSKCSYTRGS